MENINNVVVSTRIRLARNVAEYPFPNRLTGQKELRQIVRVLGVALGRIDRFRTYYMDALSEDEERLFKENYLISQKLIDNKSISAVLLNSDESVSIMVNEEDHLREQCWRTGFCLAEAYEYLSRIDDRIGECLHFAFDRRLGYLTACPTNLGTGMRASVMLFLPEMTRQHKMKSVCARMRSIGMTIRGAYGEGSESEGFMYQLSNEATLGTDEESILESVREETLKIVDSELRAREEAFALDPIGLQDACGRAYGVLTRCKRLSYREFLKLTAELKVGASLGMFEPEALAGLEEMVISMRDSNIKRYFTSIGQEELLCQRAKMARIKIKELIGEDID